MEAGFSAKDWIEMISVILSETVGVIKGKIQNLSERFEGSD